MSGTLIQNLCQPSDSACYSSSGGFHPIKGAFRPQIVSKRSPRSSFYQHSVNNSGALSSIGRSIVSEIENRHLITPPNDKHTQTQRDNTTPARATLSISKGSASEEHPCAIPELVRRSQADSKMYQRHCPPDSESGEDSEASQSKFTMAPDRSVEDDEDDDEVEDDELSGATSDGDDGAEQSVKSAAERLSEKRKMKRFRSVNDMNHACSSSLLFENRLTHSQTRFLMNEFARQPNPDASHRAKLSNEIPGLSSRQVQVWFQNRCV